MEKEFFIKMNLTRQAHYTWEHGIHLAKVEGFQFDYDLYRLENFYVEIIYNLELGQVESVEGFDQQEKLMIYLEQVDISELLK